MSVKKAFAVAAAAALPVAVSADKTITQSLFLDTRCSTPLAGTEPQTYPADGKYCVDTSLTVGGQGWIWDRDQMSFKYECDGATVTTTHFPGVTDCDGVTGVPQTSSLGECVAFTQDGITLGIKISGCVGNDDGGDDGGDSNTSTDGPTAPTPTPATAAPPSTDSASASLSVPSVILLGLAVMKLM